MNYREAIDWLYSTQMFGIKLGLEGPTRLLRDFLAFPPHRTKVIHVAGTNGKGSTCATAVTPNQERTPGESASTGWSAAVVNSR